MSKAEDTRQAILQKAYSMTYAHGYRTTSIDDIIATTQVTKGAFYYHFKNKDEMGVAIVNEILKPLMTGNLARMLQKNESPLDAVYGLMDFLLLKSDALKAEFGCPAANLTQEMAPWNTAFSAALQELNKGVIREMTDIIEKGKKAGYVKASVIPAQVTLFVLSGYWGVRTMAKLGNSKAIYTQYLKALRQYLQSLG